MDHGRAEDPSSEAKVNNLATGRKDGTFSCDSKTFPPPLHLIIMALLQGCIDHNINCLKKWIEGLFRYEQQLNRKRGGNGDIVVAPMAASSVGATANSYR